MNHDTDDEKEILDEISKEYSEVPEPLKESSRSDRVQEDLFNSKRGNMPAARNSKAYSFEKNPEGSEESIDRLIRESLGSKKNGFSISCIFSIILLIVLALMQILFVDHITYKLMYECYSINYMSFLGFILASIFWIGCIFLIIYRLIFTKSPTYMLEKLLKYKK